MACSRRFSVGYGGCAPHVKQKGFSALVKPIRGRCRWRVASCLAPCQTLPGGLATMPVRFALLQKVRSPEQRKTVRGPLAIIQSRLERPPVYAILSRFGCGHICPP